MKLSNFIFVFFVSYTSAHTTLQQIMDVTNGAIQGAKAHNNQNFCLRDARVDNGQDADETTFYPVELWDQPEVYVFIFYFLIS